MGAVVWAGEVIWGGVKEHKVGIFTDELLRYEGGIMGR